MTFISEAEMKAYDECQASMTKPPGFGNAEHYRLIRSKDGPRYILENLPDLIRELTPIPEYPLDSPGWTRSPLSNENRYIPPTDELEQLKGHILFLERKLNEHLDATKRRGKDKI